MTKLKLTAAAAAIAALSTPSFAGSLPSGFYGGLNIGYDIGKTATATLIDGSGNYFAPASITDINTAGPFDLNRDGINGGAQLGYNYMSGMFGFGIEADFAYMGRSETQSITATYTCCGPSTFTSTQFMERDWLATFRARLGVDVGGAFLYGTGGLALGDVAFGISFVDNYPLGISTPQTFSVSGTELGWTAGGGLEIPFGTNYSAKLEYLYVDLGSQAVGGTLTAADTSSDPIFGAAEFKQHVARFGINMHF